MNNSNHSHFVLVAALAVALPFQASCQGKPSKSSSLADYILRSQVGMDFYGKVVDDQGNPVAGAVVKIHTRHFSPTGDMFLGVSEHERRTNATGCFSVEGMVGLGLGIADIKKIGYEFSRHSNLETSFDYQKNHTMVHKPDPGNPIVYRLRKKGEETYVIKGDFRWQFDIEGPWTQFGFDFIANAAIKAKDGEIPFEMIGGEGLEGVRRQCDLKFRTTHDPQTKTWTVVLASGRSDGGLIVSERLLYAAPNEGYQPSHTFVLKKGQILKDRYIYLRSRNPAIYMRLDLDDRVVADVNHAFLRGNLFVNPYGERNLEMATDLPIDVSTGLKKEIREEFARGGRPRKPDLPKLVQEWEQNRPLKDKVKDWFKN